MLVFTNEDQGFLQGVNDGHVESNRGKKSLKIGL